MKQFFNITINHYQFEIMDISTLVTLINVTLVLMGVWFAPCYGLINCIISIVISIKNHGHINSYVMNIALIVLNIHFLVG